MVTVQKYICDDAWMSMLEVITKESQAAFVCLLGWKEIAHLISSYKTCISPPKKAM